MQAAPDSSKPDRGRRANRPLDIPLLGWKDVVARVWHRFQRDRMTMLAGSVAFFALFSLFPLIVAGVSAYGLFTSEGALQAQLADLTSALPGTAGGVIDQQVRAIVGDNRSGLSFRALGSILIALWAASLGTSRLMEAIGIAYEEPEERGVLHRRALALAITLGLLVVGLLSVALVALVPSVAGWIGLGGIGATLAGAVRWVLLAAIATASLAVLYRVGADRSMPRLKWISWGSVLATTLWLAASFGFSFYVEHFGSFGKTYGALGGVVVLMLWLYLTALAILTGAEVNAEIEAQTTVDSTVGEPKPMGQRNAVKADCIGPARAESENEAPAWKAWLGGLFGSS